MTPDEQGLVSSFAQVAFFNNVNMIVTITGYGAFVLGTSIAVLSLRRRGPWGPSQISLLICLFIIFICFTWNVFYSGGFNLMDIQYTFQYMPSWAATVNLLLSDCIVVWTAWVMFQYDKLWRLALVVLMIANIGVNIADCIWGDIELNIEVASFTTLDWLSSIISLAVNIFATLLIAFKAWNHHRFMTTLFLRKRTRAQNILLLLVESGAMYCAIQSVYAVFILLDVYTVVDVGFSQAMNIITAMSIVAAACYPVAVIILIRKDSSPIVSSDFCDAGMDHRVGFESLPIELDCLIANQITDTATLSALTLVSRKLYVVFTPELFRSVNRAEALPTLASSQNERFPLRNPHPASFVKHLDIWIPHKDYDPQSSRNELRLLRIVQNCMPQALYNISVYGEKAVLRSFKIDLQTSTTSFTKLIGNIDEENQLFESLHELSLRCCFPVKDFRQSLARLKMALGPSLRSFELHRPTEGGADPRSLSKLLSLVGEYCNNLTRLCIELPREREKPHKDLQVLFDDAAFTFPSLTVFSFTDDRNFLQPQVIQQAVDITYFLQRHTNIEEIGYHCLHKISLRQNGMLPHLTRFCGFLPQALDLCGDGTRPLESLSISIDGGSNETHSANLISALKKTAIIRRLIIKETRLRRLYLQGFSSSSINSIIAICANLTHLQCTFGIDTTTMLQQSLRAISNLRRLEHLKLMTIKSVYKEIPKAEYEPFGAKEMRTFIKLTGHEIMLAMRDAFGAHENLQTALFVVYGWFGTPMPWFHRPPIQARFALRKGRNQFHIEDQNDSTEWDFGNITPRTATDDDTRFMAEESDTFDVLQSVR
ncbi:hypothetical protein J3R30DRAFT_3694966 [Lentinula aciculospora]|uniref:Uncharacterized protein n=1 Tax=Lentinula aciculospora TaxID=153920 RepID=A0A9W9AWR5_9AGAR|nr:hypothetical protein J3R30DRAFT_3694966 [Lentinula aciculospora]